MSSERIGQFLALGTALCWTISSMSFEAASRRSGSIPVNFLRIVMAFVGLSLLGLIGSRHLPLPTDASPHAWKWLLLSGFVGFFIGDLALFRAFVEMGARLSSLTQSLAPPLAALTAALFVPDQRMSFTSWIGMSVTIVGIMWVITEREIENESPGKIARRATPRGLALGLVGAAGQGVGLVLTKIGMRDFDYAFAANQIRSIAGLVGFGLLILVTRDLARVGRTLRDRRAMGFLTIGAISGPLLGVSMLLQSMSMGVTPGVAQTFASLVPVMIIPFLVVMGKEHVTWRAVIGAVIAVAGVAILLNA